MATGGWSRFPSGFPRCSWPSQQRFFGVRSSAFAASSSRPAELLPHLRLRPYRSPRNRGVSGVRQGEIRGGAEAGGLLPLPRHPSSARSETRRRTHPPSRRPHSVSTAGVVGCAINGHRAILLRLLASMLLGASTMFAVAWACAALPKSSLAFQSHRYAVLLKVNTVGVIELRRVGLSLREWYWVDPPSDPWGFFLALPAPINEREDRYPGKLPWGRIEEFPSGPQAQISAGWPWRCVWAELNISGWGKTSSMSCDGGILLTGATVQGVDLSDTCVLPYSPLWRGIAANLLVYTLACAMMLLAVPPTCELLRRWCGRCPTCGYPLTGLPAAAACPECGKGK